MILSISSVDESSETFLALRLPPPSSGFQNVVVCSGEVGEPFIKNVTLF